MNTRPEPTTPVPQDSRVAGAFALFGLVAAIGSIFALIITATDVAKERAQSQWPMTSAVIQASEVSPNSSRDGRESLWRLRCRISYSVDGKEWKSTIGSRGTNSDSEIGKIRAWAARHPKGTLVDLRYDPREPHHVVFASDSSDTILGLPRGRD